MKMKMVFDPFSESRQQLALQLLSDCLQKSIYDRLCSKVELPLLKQLKEQHISYVQPIITRNSKDLEGSFLKSTTNQKSVRGPRGVEMLKKVNTSKMNKLTSFFQKSQPNGESENQDPRTI